MSLNQCLFKHETTDHVHTFPFDGICGECRSAGVTLSDIITVTMDGTLSALDKKNRRRTAFLTWDALIYPLFEHGQRVVLELMSDGDVVETVSDPYADERFYDVSERASHQFFPVDADQAAGYSTSGAFDFKDRSSRYAVRDARYIGRYSGISLNN